MVNKIINSDCIEGLKTLPDESVDCCVTSPPYFGLRDYGHDGQIGLEDTPEAFVGKMVEVFTEVKRVLKKEGTLWLNLGDSYSGSGKGGQSEEKRSIGWQPEYGNKGKTYGLKPKDLIGVPWMVAFALRSSGWYLRQDIIWHKPNPMPESVTDRCTKAHEYIFLLSKSAKYYYDHEAIKYEMIESSIQRNQNGWNGNEDRGWIAGKQNNLSKYLGSDKAKEQTLANKRSVWTVTTKPFSDAHFATFPEDLIVDCIKAGCPEGGIVLDPFSGAGTTALVASKLNRDFIGFELNPEYIEITKKRLQNELGMFNKLIA
jgi:DNA modification methylase